METSRTARLALVATGVVLALIAFELGCQVYGWVLYRRFAEIRSRPAHYLQATRDPVLGYELKPGTYDRDGRVLRINRHGIREEREGLFRNRRRLAVLGDSVVFGTGHDQRGTIPRRLEGLLGEGASEVVLNFGVPGYAARELGAFLRAKDAVYSADAVVYLLNPNDFVRRESVYEGADNGLYRMYNRPRWMSPWFVRKAVYRLHKRGLISIPWYEWTFAGNRDHTLREIEAMAAYARERGIAFGVVLLPAGVAYREGGYALDSMYAAIGVALGARGIPWASAVAEFATDPAGDFDETDHLTDAGNARMAAFMRRFADERLRDRRDPGSR